MNSRQALFDYVLRLADSNLILGQQLSAWCAHAPTLEQDVAMINIALDLLGQARSLLTYAGKIEGRERSEDDLAYLRDSRDWRNVLLVEQTNGDFARTIVRQFFYDAFSFELYSALVSSQDLTLAAVAEKAIKEVTYHRRHSSQWLIRLGDGTAESHRRVQEAVDDLWRYTGELFLMDSIDRQLLQTGIAVDLEHLKQAWSEWVDPILDEATLQKPEDGWMPEGGKRGLHSEQMGYLLAEMQYLQRAYPGASW